MSTITVRSGGHETKLVCDSGATLLDALRLDSFDIAAPGGARGQETEIRIVAENILKTRNKLNEILAANTGKTVEEIARDTERDNYMTAQEALAYGLIDSIVEKR